MLDLRRQLSDLPAVRGRAPWPGCEYVKGWGVFGLPFDTGHVLALRVFPENDFGPYRTLWHRDPLGRWSIYVDGPRLDTACPRYYGAACDHVGKARIDLQWLGPATLRVHLDCPVLDWVLTAVEPARLRLINSVNSALGLSTWRRPAMVHARERMAGGLGIGRLRMAGVMPSGHTGILMPRRMYFVDDSAATLDGVALGRPTRLRDNPTIGDVPLPARGVLATGQGIWQIRDLEEYERTRSQTSATA